MSATRNSQTRGESLETHRANAPVTSTAVDIIIFGDYMFYGRSKNLYE